MWCVGFLVLIFGVGIESLVCPVGKHPCGSSRCFDPATQGCNVTNATLQCLNSCDGTCIPNYQYCYNNVKVCNKTEFVCDIKKFSSFTRLPLGLTCYEPSQKSCYNDTLCDKQTLCGSQCLTDNTTSCAKNQTVCSGFNYWEYYNRLGDLDVCGPQQQCYDKTKSVCLNGIIVCDGLNAQLCGTNCYHPDAQTCVNNVVDCINSCNGSCYSNSEYCYNDTIICKKNELVCDVQNTPNGRMSLGLTCYDPSRTSCLEDMLCDNENVCGSQCLTDQVHARCVKNQKICAIGASGNPYGVDICGPQQECYFTSSSICVNETTVCEKSKTQLCGSTCYNPKTQICVSGTTVQCLNSCNGVCYSNSQYCHNNNYICNNDQLFCDIQVLSNLIILPSDGSLPDGLSSTYGPACYDPSLYACYNNALCYKRDQCGTECLTSQYSFCVKNQTICDGFDYWNYYNRSGDLNVCGPQKECYDKTENVCLNGTIICNGLNAQLCGTSCSSPELHICVNDTIQCLNSCRGTCHSSSQYCYNDTKICNNDQSVCHVTKYSVFLFQPLGHICYNTSQLNCHDGVLCSNDTFCGSQCLTARYSACTKDETICYGFDDWNLNPGRRYLDACGPEQKCYDSATSVCLGDSAVCPIGSALCSGACYNPNLQSCAGDNSTIYCFNNSSAPDYGCYINPGD